jgi:hypothetical protein
VPAFSTPSPVAANLTQIVSVCMATYFFIFDVKDSMRKEIRKALKTAAAAVEAGAAFRSVHFLPCPALHRPAAVLRSEAQAEGASLARCDVPQALRSSSVRLPGRPDGRPRSGPAPAKSPRVSGYGSANNAAISPR